MDSVLFAIRVTLSELKRIKKQEETIVIPDPARHDLRENNWGEDSKDEDAA